MRFPEAFPLRPAPVSTVRAGVAAPSLHLYPLPGRCTARWCHRYRHLVHDPHPDPDFREKPSLKVDFLRPGVCDPDLVVHILYCKTFIHLSPVLLSALSVLQNVLSVILSALSVLLSISEGSGIPFRFPYQILHFVQNDSLSSRMTVSCSETPSLFSSPPPGHPPSIYFRSMLFP